MPSKYVVRSLKAESVYHIFNNSVGERGLFLDTQDFRVFLFYLYIYTTPSEEVAKKFSDLPMRLAKKTLTGKLEILAYCLLGNHFHLIIKQHALDGMPRLMKQVINGYTAYYNQKYKHIGPVFAGRYKAIELQKDQLLDTIRYIHKEPKSRDYEWSSYPRYQGKENMIHCDVSLFLDTFGTQERIIKFHENIVSYERSLEKIKSPLCLG